MHFSLVILIETSILKFASNVMSIGGFIIFQLAVQSGFGGASSTAKASWMVDITEQWLKECGTVKIYLKLLRRIGRVAS